MGKDERELHAESHGLRELAYDSHWSLLSSAVSPRVVWRDAFRFLFNAQFLGADVASLLPRDLTASIFVGTLLMLIVVAWVFGYAWAWLYNRIVRVA
jgi:hypothetical protein